MTIVTPLRFALACNVANYQQRQPTFAAAGPRN
jgi:hypothetical protein